MVKAEPSDLESRDHQYTQPLVFLQKKKKQ